ncbi:MAG: NAD(P)H-dependent oxidoreductase [Pseudomonadota bacterium]|nr:NAD(P)H-dependent oxidoreductase [Pseudomonadota bacterium]
MVRRIVIIQGIPDPKGKHFGNALAEAYMLSAQEAGHEVKIIEVAHLDFPLLRTQKEFESGEPPAAIRQAQKTIDWAEHLIILYPLWLGTMPALLKAFLEQVFRPGFAFSAEEGSLPKKLLIGKSARIIITMGMPALVYRWYFRAHSLKSLERNILRFCGIAPIKETLIGMVETVSDKKREKWLDKMRKLGRKGG